MKKGLKKSLLIENQGKTEVANSQIIVIFLRRFMLFSNLSVGITT